VLGLTSNRWITGNFGEKSFQAITCAGTEDQTIPKRKYTKNKITNLTQIK